MQARSLIGLLASGLGLGIHQTRRSDGEPRNPDPKPGTRTLSIFEPTATATSLRSVEAVAAGVAPACIGFCPGANEFLGGLRTWRSMTVLKNIVLLALPFSRGRSWAECGRPLARWSQESAWQIEDGLMFRRHGGLRGLDGRDSCPSTMYTPRNPEHFPASSPLLAPVGVAGRLRACLVKHIFRTSCTRFTRVTSAKP